MNVIRTLTTVGAASAALAVAAPLGASPPAPISGTGLLATVVVTDVRTADGNTHMDLIATGTVSGSVSGTFVIHRHQVIHPSGKTTVADFTEVTGMTPCGAGTVAIRFVAMTDETGVLEGHGTTINNSFNTANLHLNFDVVAPPGPAFTYSGTYHCD